MGQKQAKASGEPEWVARAYKGDESTLPMVRQALEKRELMEAAGNLARMAQQTLVGKFCGPNLVSREAIGRKMDELRSELSGENPSAIERLLVEQVVTCWLYLHHQEMCFVGKDTMAMKLASHYQRCISQAQRRYLAALKTLATVRKLALPPVQINIARKQVNVSGSSVVGEASRGV